MIALESLPSKPRRHKGSTMLSPRDRWALRWMAEQYAISLDQLQVLLGMRAGHGTKRPNWISQSAVRQVLARWHKLGYIEQKNVFTDYPAWIWLTRRAITELGLSSAHYTPNFATLPHLHAINHVRLFVEQLYPEDVWKSERMLKAERPRYTAGSTPPHTPDAELVAHFDQEITAIEVELSVKERGSLHAILTDLSNRYGSVWYFATRMPLHAVSDTLAKMDARAQERIKVYALEQISSYHPLTL